MKSLYCFVFYLLFILPISISAQCDQAITPTNIEDNSDFIIILPVSGAQNDDLGDPLQGICGINIEFTHDAISDLVIQLTSPSGQVITLVGDFNSVGNITLNADWDVSFVPCFVTPSPDLGILDTIWSNDAAWTNLGGYTGSYYPANGCLEDFNTGSVNGNWVLRIIDGAQFNAGSILSFGITFCDDTGLLCTPCSPEGGSQTNMIFNRCTNEDLNLDFMVIGENTDVDYSYLYLVTQNGELVEIKQDTDFSNLAAGSYEVCGVSILEENTSELINTTLTYTEIVDGAQDGSLEYCLDLSDNCTVLEIIEAPPIQIIDEKICLGESFPLGGQMFTNEGSYPVLVPSTTGGCDTNYVLNLEVVEIDPMITSSATELTCSNNTLTLDRTLSLQENTSSFTWSTSDGLFDGAPDDETIEIMFPGTYILEQSEDGCILQEVITINENAEVPNVSISAPALSCSDPSVLITVSSDVAIQSAQWMGPGGFTSSEIEPTVSFAGSYFVELIDISGCRINRFFELQQGIDQAVITLSANELTCENSSTLIDLQSNTSLTSFQWTGPNGFNAEVQSPLVNTPGMYFVEAEDEDECRSFATIEVVGNLQSFDYQVFGNTFLCPGGSKRIEAVSSISGSFYSWSGPNGFQSNEPNPAVTSEGTYYVDIIANGCVVRDSVVVDRDISELPDYEIEIDTLGDCENPRFLLTAIPLENEFQTSLLRWVVNGIGVIGTGSQIEVSNTGTFRLFVNSLNGCLVIRNITISPLDDAPSISLIQKQQVNCNSGLGEGILDVTYDSGFSYSWEGPNGYIADTSRIENLEHGFYFLTVTDINSGCVTEFNDRIILDTLPRNSNISSTAINCNNSISNVTLAVNGGGNTYNWQGPDGSFTTRNIEVSQGGLYYLTVTGGNGCITLDSVDVIEDFAPPNIILQDTVVDCSSGAAPLTTITSDPGVVYEWTGSNNFTSNTASPIVFLPGEYYLEATGINGCVLIDTIVISENPDTPVPLLSFSNTLDCIDTSATLFGIVDIPVVSYQWMGPDGFESDQQNPIVSEPGTYYIRVATVNQCIGRDSITLDQIIILPESSFVYDSLSCVEANAVFSATSTDPGATFNWFGPNNYSESGSNVSAQDTGEYILATRGSNNCVALDTFLLDTKPVDLDLANLINCYNPTIQLDTLDEILDFQIEWTGPDGFTSLENTPIVSEQGTYTGTMVGSNGCMGSLSITVELDTVRPIAIVNQSGLLKCEVTQTEISGIGSSEGEDFIYSWDNIGGDIISSDSSIVISIDGPGEYTLTVIDTTNGCPSSAMIDIVVEPNDIAGYTAEGVSQSCFGVNDAMINISEIEGGTGPFSYSLDNVLYLQDPTFTDLPPGEYNVYVKDSFGCILATDVIIEEVDAVELDLGDNLDVFLGDDVEISANTNLTMEQIESIYWQIADQVGCSDCLSFTLNPDQDILIELTITDENGCIFRDEVNVRVDQDPVLYKPNIFSPNNDGVNDIFFLSSNPGVLQIRSLFIFDRWGTKVFENFNFLPGDPNAGWDGTLNGSNLLPGVYVYQAEIEMITGVIRPIKGEVAIIR